VDDPRLGTLIDAYLDGALSPEQHAELEGALLTSPAAREQFWAHASLHGLMREAAELKWGKAILGPEGPANEAAVVPRRRVRGRIGRWVGVAAGVLVVLGLGAWFALSPRGVAKGPGLQVVSPARPVAKVVVVAEARWSEPAGDHGPGSELGTGRVKLVSGAAQLEFADGARVILEGPAEFVIIGGNQARCQAGRMSVQIPATARGFQVTSPLVSVVDLGTEFGLFVPEARPTEVHVFDGKVKASWGAGLQESQVLAAGEALRVKPGKAVTTRAKRGAFLTEQELARRAAAARDAARPEPTGRK
jgi:ferric-dicitrate binding protein FerR (iron transport regulator)